MASTACSTSPSARDTASPRSDEPPRSCYTTTCSRKSTSLRRWRRRRERCHDGHLLRVRDRRLRSAPASSQPRRPAGARSHGGVGPVTRVGSGGALTMKVVLFCGGLGTRIREYSDTIPKPMIPIGYRPMLWHVMKYYAHFGHREFILCLGYRGDVVKQYFLNYNECLSNDFVLTKGGRDL